MALLEVRNLTREFRRAAGVFRRPEPVRVLDGVTFDVEPGEVFGLLGESGSGKTTAARCILRLIEPTGGEIRFAGRDVLALAPGEMRQMRRQMQMIFQDPDSSLNPRLTAGAIIEEPLIIHRAGTPRERNARVRELLALVGLEPAHESRYPREFSGGQRQRIGIARALALNPSFIVADEPVSALDVSVQAQILNLLMDLQERLRLTCLFISHDLRVVRHICRRVAVMHRGRIVESGPTAGVFDAPAHPHTRALVEAGARATLPG